MSSTTTTYAAKKCYDSSGNENTKQVVCNPEADVSSCCFPGDICYSNGLCVGGPEQPNKGFSDWYYNGCTDSTWNSTACVTECRNVKGNGIDACPGFGQYCCFGFSGCDCSDSAQIVNIPAGTVVTTIPMTTATLSTVTATVPTTTPSSRTTTAAAVADASATSLTSLSIPGHSASSTSSSYPTPNSNGTLTGSSGRDAGTLSLSATAQTGIGVGVGVIVGLLVGWWFFQRRRRRLGRRPHHQQPHTEHFWNKTIEHVDNNSQYMIKHKAELDATESKQASQVAELPPGPRRADCPLAEMPCPEDIASWMGK